MKFLGKNVWNSFIEVCSILFLECIDVFFSFFLLFLSSFFLSFFSFVLIILIYEKLFNHGFKVWLVCMVRFAPASIYFNITDVLIEFCSYFHITSNTKITQIPSCDCSVLHIWWNNLSLAKLNIYFNLLLIILVQFSYPPNIFKCPKHLIIFWVILYCHIFCFH